MSKVTDTVAAVSSLTPAELVEFEALVRDTAAAADGDTADDLATLVAAGTALDVVDAAKAGGSRIRRMAAAAGRPTPSPEAVRHNGGAVLVASGHLQGVTAGEPIVDRWQLAEAMSATLRGMSKTDPPRGRVLLASAHWGDQYPEERRLSGDQERNARILDGVLGPQALVASGGICSPINVDYTVPTYATADRPLRDGLPPFLADRGGLTYIQAPSLASLADATTVWTEAIDFNPAGATKPVLQVVCGTPTTQYVDAVPTRLGFGNMTARFAPEQTAANTDLAMAAAARIAENNLLQRIAAACTADITTAILLGATRDVLTAVGQAAAGLRSLHRIADSTMLTAVFPNWLKELMRIDLARELAHGNNADFNSFGLTDDQVDDLLKVRGINAIWHIDGQPNTVAGGVAQVFGAQAASGVINVFPSKVVWYLWPEGSVQFLDGGRLDLGVIRDSTLDATNDYEVMVEPLEGLAFRGCAGQAQQFVSTLCANGTSAGTTSTTSDCA